MRKITDWAAVDWHESNEQVAALTGAAITTVIKRRTLFGHPADRRPYTRPDNAERNRRPERRAEVATRQPIATAAAKASPLAGRGPDNVHAIEWRLVAPDGTLHVVRNLYDFVRSNPGLFATGDVEWKRQGGGRGTGGEYCNATAGILNVRAGKSRAWKGWTLDQRPDRTPSKAAPHAIQVTARTQPRASRCAPGSAGRFHP